MSYSSSLRMPNSEERGSERIRKYLKYLTHLYILFQLLRFHIWLDAESWKLFRSTLEYELKKP